MVSAFFAGIQVLALIVCMLPGSVAFGRKEVCQPASLSFWCLLSMSQWLCCAALGCAVL
jgi:hypothetical protein